MPLPIWNTPAQTVVAAGTVDALTLEALDTDPLIFPFSPAVSFQIIGGPDEALFEIQSLNRLRFLAPTSAATPLDQNSDNVYQLTVRATNQQGSFADRSFSLTVNAPPVFATATVISIAEAAAVSNTLLLQIEATDFENKQLTYQLLPGKDAALFSVAPGNGDLRLLQTLDFESPIDTDKNNEYLIDVKVSDADGLSTTQTISVRVGNSNEAPVLSALDASVFKIDEGTTPVTRFTATDPDTAAPTDPTPILIGKDESSVIVIDGGGLSGSSDSFGRVTFALNGGPDVKFFTINQSTGALAFLKAPSADLPQDANEDNTYVLGVKVVDGAGASDQAQISVQVLTVAPSNAPPVIVSFDGASDEQFTMDEGRLSVVGLLAEDPNKDPLSWRLIGGDDAARFLMDAKGSLRFKALPDFERPTDQGRDNGYDVVVQVSDGKGGTDTLDLQVVIRDLNETPVFTEVNQRPIEADTRAVTVPAMRGQGHVALLTAEDPDQGDTIRYALAGGPDIKDFVLDPRRGFLSLRSPFAGEGRVEPLKVVVEARDSGGLRDRLEVTVPAASARLGSPRGDVLQGTQRNDRIDGREGNDSIRGLGGNDALAGGPGKDGLRGGAGRDTLLGGNGDDLLDGGDGSDLLLAEALNDILFGGPGNDTLNGGAGSDQLIGGPGTDILIGGDGRDLVVEGPGPDIMIDFSKGDAIRLSRQALPGLGPEGPLQPGRFRTGPAQDPDDRILFFRSDDSVRFDADGNGPRQPEILIFLPDANVAPSAVDFSIV